LATDGARRLRHGSLTEPTKPAESAAGETSWSTFDSLSLQNLGNDRYKAEVGYETKDGKVEHLTFEGTREELRKEITARKDLPDNEREHLLRSLDMPNEMLEFDFPSIRIAPDGRMIWDFGHSSTSF
jgi:hypothetical protein